MSLAEKVPFNYGDIKCLGDEEEPENMPLNKVLEVGAVTYKDFFVSHRTGSAATAEAFCHV